VQTLQYQMTSKEELEVLGSLRDSPPGIDRATVALLVDNDPRQARQELQAEELRQRRHFERLVPPQPGRFSFSACGVAVLAACDVLCHAPPERRLDPLGVAFEPHTANVFGSGCNREECAVALAVLAWLLGDELRCARLLIPCRPHAILDVIVKEVTAALVQQRYHAVGEVLARRGPEYIEAMARGLWKKAPDGFLHVRLLAVLKTAAERTSMRSRSGSIRSSASGMRRTQRHRARG
jgi:hypothetical protein